MAEQPMEVSTKAGPSSLMAQRLAMMRRSVGTNKLRNMLREKCRIRVKECRRKQFDISRDFLADEKNWIADLLKDELKELEENIELEDFLYEEFVDESYKWLLDEYERETQYYASMGPNEPPIALCPICQASELTKEGPFVQCTCGVRLRLEDSVASLAQRMQGVGGEHAAVCHSGLSFFVEPNASGDSALRAWCDSCDYFSSIVE